MYEYKKRNIIRITAVVIALLLVVTVSFASNRTSLRASEEMMESAQMDEFADVPVEEALYVPSEDYVEPEPVITTEETQEIDVGDIPEAEDETVCDHVFLDGFCIKCGAADPDYIMPDSDEDLPPVEDLDLDEEDLDIDKEDEDEEDEDEEEEEPFVVSIWYVNQPEDYGDAVTIASSVIGGKKGAPVYYQWQYSDDGGVTWWDAPNGNMPTFTFVTDEYNAFYMWGLSVYN